MLPDIVRGRSSTCCRPTTVPVAALAALPDLEWRLTKRFAAIVRLRAKIQGHGLANADIDAGCSIWRKPVMATARRISSERQRADQ